MLDTNFGHDMPVILNGFLITTDYKLTNAQLKYLFHD